MRSTLRVWFTAVSLAGLLLPCLRAEPSGVSMARKIVLELSISPGDRDLLEMLRGSLARVTDEKDLAELMVIYCLGCYYTGQDAKAESVKPAILRKCPNSDLIKYLTSAYTKETCSACDGTGKRMTACPDCEGRGHCGKCGGKGFFMMAGIGKQNKVTCPKCKGTGECLTCEGTGRVEKPCPVCGGDGLKTSHVKIQKLYTALLCGKPVDDNAIASLQPLRKPDRPSPYSPRSSHHPSTLEPRSAPTLAVKPGDTQKQMNAYVHQMEMLDKLFARNGAVQASLTEVLMLPDRFLGKLVKCNAYVISCYPREVVVAARSTARREEGAALIPRSLEVGMKAQEIFKTVGNGQRVKITYGIVSEDNRTLFDIEAL